MERTSCRTVALYGPFYFIFFAVRKKIKINKKDHTGLQFAARKEQADFQ
jgi:hypothetical protein